MVRFLLFFCFLSFCGLPLFVRAGPPPYKAVSLGNWLLTEGWMEHGASRFDGIPNNDLLDGTQIQLQSVKLQKYLTCENGGGSSVLADRDSASGWETFTLWRINENTFNFRVSNKQFVGFRGTKVVAESTAPGASETFEIVRENSLSGNRVRIKASNGMFLQANSELSVTADYGGSGWENDNPSVFNMMIVKNVRGEYQITNGYGPDRAPQVMREHWNSYITDADFKFMSEHGLTAVKIPVGWWIASDPTPPRPFVGGSLQALDNAFSCAQKYGLKIIIDLHAVNGSQNGGEYTGTRDGSKEWGEFYIQETVAVVDFLAQRYANSPSLAAIELMSNPTAPEVTYDSLNKYYKAGYAAVRKHTSDAYVILSPRSGPVNPMEFLNFEGERIVLDVHFYNKYSDHFAQMSAQENIDYVIKKRPFDLSAFTMPNGPLIFVGEWTADWEVQEPSIEEHQRFAKAQQEVYSQALFGWAYWTYKCDFTNWSLKWMIENGYITV